MTADEVTTRAAAATRSNVLFLPVLAVLGLVGTLLVARALSTSEFVVYAVVIAVRNTAQFLADVGSGSASTRAFARLEQRGDRSGAIRLYERLFGYRGLAVFVVLTAWAVAPGSLRDLLGLHPGDADLLWIIVGIVVLEILAVLGSYVLIGLLRHATVNRVGLAQGLVQPLGITLAVVLDLGITGVLVALLVTSLVRTTALHANAVRAIRSLRDTTDPAAAVIEERLAKTAAAAGVGKLAAWLNSRQALSLFAIKSAPSAEFAVFALAYDFTHQVLSPVGGPVGTVLGPAVAKTRDAAQIQRITAAGIRGLSLLALGAAALLVVVLTRADQEIFGARFADMHVSVAILAPAVAIEIALLLPLTSAMLADDSWLRAYGLVRASTAAMAVLYIIVGVSDLVAVMAILASIRAIGAIALLVVYTRRSPLPIGVGWWVRLAVALASGTGIGLIGGLIGDGIGAAAIGGVAFVVTYVGAARWLRLVRVDELQAVSRVFPRFEPALSRLLVPAARAPA